MWGKLAYFFRNRSEQILGIDIGSKTVKMAYVSNTQGYPKIEKIHIFDLPADCVQDNHIFDVDLLSYAIRKELEITGISAKHAVAAISGKLIFMREVLFPMMKQEELREAVHWDIEKYVPYPLDSYYYDFAVLNKQPEDLELQVFLVAAPKNVIDGLSEVLSKAGLTTMAIDIEPIAVYRTIQGGENSLLLDVGAETSHITVFQSGVPVLARTIPLSISYFEEDSMQPRGKNKRNNEMPMDNTFSNIQPQVNQLASELLSEIRLTVEHFQRQKTQIALDKLYLCGGGSKLSNLKEQLEREADIPVVLHNPFKAIEVDASFDPGFLADIAPQIAVAVGLALRGL